MAAHECQLCEQEADLEPGTFTPHQHAGDGEIEVVGLKWVPELERIENALNAFFGRDVDAGESWRDDYRPGSQPDVETVEEREVLDDMTKALIAALGPDGVTCDYCKRECVDFRQRDGKRACVLCLSTWLDEDRETLDGITAACEAAGYDVDGDACEATWIDAQLAELALLRATTTRREG